MKSGSSQVHVVMWIQLRKIKKLMLSRFFNEKGKSKADYIRKESAHIVIPKDTGLSKLKRVFT